MRCICQPGMYTYRSRGMDSMVTRSYSGWKLTTISTSVRNEVVRRSDPASSMLNVPGRLITGAGRGRGVTWVGPGVPKFGGGHSRGVEVESARLCLALAVDVGRMGKNGDGVADRAGWLNAGVQAVSARATTARDFAARAIRMGEDYSIVAKR